MRRSGFYFIFLKYSRQYGNKLEMQGLYYYRIGGRKSRTKDYMMLD